MSAMFVRFFRNSMLRLIIALLIAAAAGLAAAQIISSHAPSPASFFPGGAIVYVETQNLNELLQWWNNSELKDKWEDSDNYKRFQNSTLYIKLQERLSEFGKDKFNMTIENLETLAGARSGIAVYDIGELKILAATEISATGATSTELWLSREKFRRKTIDGVPYYIEPDGGKLAFGYVKPFLVVATEESLIQNFIRIHSGKQKDSLSESVKWQQCRVLNPEGGFLSLFLDQETLNGNRYFKKYWIHRNVKDFQNLKAVWIDLSLAENELIERRYFVSDNAQQAQLETKTFHRPLAAFNADYVAFESSPMTDELAANLIRYVNRFSREYHQSSYPPAYSGAAERASQAEVKNTYFQQINEPILQQAGDQILKINQEKQIASLLSQAEPEVQIRLTHPLWDDLALFMHFRETLAIEFKNISALNRDEVLQQLAIHFKLLASIQDQRRGWKQIAGDTFVFENLNAFYVRFADPWMIAATSQEDLERVTSVLPQWQSQGANSAVAVDFNNGRWKFSRFTRRLDHGAYVGEEPLFFSENLTSLFHALSQVQKTTITRYGNKEEVRYELQ